MALDFPSSPTNGQVYQNWVYDSTKGAWKSLPLTGPKTITADVPPLNPQDGDQWYNTLDGTLYVYVVDVDSSQWVESTAPISANGYYSPNYIINGGMDIWQRGTSFIIGTGNAYTADRWQAFRQGVAGLTVSRQTSGLTGIQYCLRAQRDSGVTTVAASQIWHNLETINSIPLAGKTVTLSFYARAGANYSAASGSLGANIYTGTGTDQNVNTTGFTNSTVVGTSTVSLTTSWQRFTITATISTAATQVALFFVSTPTGTAGANDYYEVTGIQLEEGSVATPFRRNANSIQGELAACQRYYYRVSPSGTFGAYGTIFCSSSTSANLQIKTPVTMRAAPSSTDFGGGLRFVQFTTAGGVISGSISSVTFSNTDSTQEIGAVVLSSTGMSPGSVGWLSANNTPSSYIGFNAEL